MELPTLPAVSLIAAGLGVASHLGYFIHGEHHWNSIRLLLLSFTGPIILFLGFTRLGKEYSYFRRASLTAVATFSYLVALSISITIYRVFFHRLHSFPGPFTAKLTKLSHVFRLIGRSDNYLQSDRLHKKYGEIVRIGPNELSIIILEAIPATVGIGSKCTKTAWYDVLSYPNKSLQLERDRATHDKRRKIWDRGFSAKALRDYESRVITHADELLRQLQAFSGKPFNATEWFHFFSFDVMSDLAFGGSFGMLKSGEKHESLKLLQIGMAPVGILTPIPWSFPIIQSLPLPLPFKKFNEFADQQMEARKKITPEKKDIMGWLLDAEKESSDPIHKDPRWLPGDSRLVIIAGSDTTAAALAHIFYHLAKEPSIAAKLREELGSVYHPGSATEVRDIQDAVYLNGVINEALRLHPPVPGGLLRQTPPEGLMIKDVFIPGDVIVSSPTWSMGRLESCYKHAEEFIPERWGEKSELLLDKSVFVPFSSGVYGCIGKQLALMEIRAVTARIVTHFDISFAPGEYGKDLIDKTKDVFTLELAPLRLVLTKRR